MEFPLTRYIELIYKESMHKKRRNDINLSFVSFTNNL